MTLLNVALSILAAGTLSGDPGVDEQDVEAHRSEPFAERDDLSRIGDIEVFDSQAS
jgi:hypothetical protein